MLVTIGKHTRTEEQWEKRRQASRAHYKSNPRYYVEHKVRNTPSYLLRVAKQRAKKKDILFDITLEDIVLPTHCPILGIPLEVNIDAGKGGKDSSYSLDRIDNSLGYVKGNVRVISHKANSMKHSATKEELILFAKYILSTYDKE
jgi:hypothetical protein